VENPENYVEAFAKAGADSMSIHVEATAHIHGALQKIKAAGMKAAIAINPGTPVSAVTPVLGLVDMVLVMTVNPGFGGQSFLPECLDKVRELAALRADRNLDFDIEVDGGITDETISLAKAAGANAFVAGSFVFNGEVAEQIKKLKERL
ncbi:MAG: ribulose-phosphate 3-epimerase, partial [Streptococcaceae bacterium]|nr:ribulose-phosphate 3-epimerase [Streptococcaceae bacterium]